MAEKLGKPNDIVQITCPDHHWFPALLIVAEKKSWGVMAYAYMPSNDGNGGEAYIRLKDGDYEVVGRAIIVHKDKEDE